MPQPDVTEHVTEPRQPISFQESQVLAQSLPDTPENVISIHCLKRGLAKTLTIGSPRDFSAAIIQTDSCPAEPNSFGCNAEEILQLLSAVEGWTCVLADSGVADALGPLIEARRSCRVRFLEDIYHVLEKPLVGFHNELVQQLRMEDLELLEAAPKELRSGSWDSTHRLLSEGIIACAIVEGQIVATALTTAFSNKYADVGVYTDPAFRQRGFALAATAIVVNQVLAGGRTPVWSTGASNTASLRMAERLGFLESSRRKYVILVP